MSRNNAKITFTDARGLTVLVWMGDPEVAADRSAKALEGLRLALDAPILETEIHVESTPMGEAANDPMIERWLMPPAALKAAAARGRLPAADAADQILRLIGRIQAMAAAATGTRGQSVAGYVDEPDPSFGYGYRVLHGTTPAPTSSIIHCAPPSLAVERAIALARILAKVSQEAAGVKALTEVCLGTSIPQVQSATLRATADRRHAEAARQALADLRSEISAIGGERLADIVLDD